MYEHVSQARRLTTLSPLKEMIAKERNPGPEVQRAEDVKQWITDSFTTIYRASL
jgi:choline dehydrogenase